MKEAYNFHNAVDYRNNPETVSDLETNIDKAIQLWGSLNEVPKQEIMKRIILEGLTKYDWNNLFKKYDVMYRTVKNFDEKEQHGFEKEHHLSDDFY